MKLNFLTFMVKDVDKGVEFYEQLAQLHVLRRFNPGIGEIVFLANAEGETMLELIQPDNGPTYSATGFGMSFKCESDLNTVREKAIAMGYNPGEIHDKGPEPVNFKVTDPNGILVEFCV